MTVRELRELLFSLKEQDLDLGIHIGGIGLPIKEIKRVDTCCNGNFKSYYAIIIDKILKENNLWKF